jgi:NAD+ synthase (glutamine-hydrolysing)
MMKHGFIKVCAATPDIKVAHCQYNGEKITQIIKECEKEQVQLVVFPELCITGYTCGDLFLQDTLLRTAKEQLLRISREMEEMDILAVVGLPFLKDGKLYNVAAVLQGGHIMGMVPKSNIPNYSEFYEARHFNVGNEKAEWISLLEHQDRIPFGTNVLFQCENLPDFILGIDICEDLWVPVPPSSRHALAGASLIVNLSASDEITGKDSYRKELVKSQSARLVCGYIYADAGEGESTTDLVFSGHNIIAENGNILKESQRFRNGIIMTELDLGKLVSERRRMTTYQISKQVESPYVIVKFSYKQTILKNTLLTRSFDGTPFVPKVKADRDIRCDEILNLQVMGLKKRVTHINCQSVVIGISGGLDSTLALLVAVKTFDMLKVDRKNIIAVTMPCFGTTDRTYQNAMTLTKQLGVTLKEIPISEAVILHLKDIGHDINVHDVTYENAQARERTQVLMNISNQCNGIVIGTGDMSELALGWATYNGDHMSMYGVNSSVPKTLVRYLVLYYAQTTTEKELEKVLLDVLDTPVSPELLPPKDGVISQKTEDIVGPYELHDFFLYYIMRFGFEPSKIFRMALLAFEGVYEKEVIYKWLGTFYRRFFASQFKRSCLPDGPKVGSVALSPRGDLRMPSDACVTMWMQELESIEGGK